MDALYADTTRRAATWVMERVEKADHLRAYDPGIPERVFLAVEASIETGFLGAEFLGLASYTWILIAAGVLLAGVAIRRIRLRRRAHTSAVVLIAAFVVIQSNDDVVQPTFLPDDPLAVDPDTLAFPRPEERPLSESFEFIVDGLGLAGAMDGPAVNVSTTGRVPNSTWFTDRTLHARMSVEQLVRGPNRRRGPDTSKAWNVVDLERDGKSIGMQVLDGRGTRYFLKLDPSDEPETSTGAEIVSTKFLHALGYHVPENYLVRFRAELLRPATESITEARIARLLRLAYRYDDGTHRAMASMHIPGDPIGPFRFTGTRSDDANDVFPHELRRELRGLRLIAAWLNHTDVRAENTLDTVISADGGAFVRHYLLDFGTTLGGSPLGLQRRWAGHEYWLQPLATMQRVLTLGLSDSEWETIEYPDIRGVGRFEAAHFEPRDWVPFQPNAAFHRMDPDDAFWAAERIARFTDEMIRAVVETGQYADSTAVDYIAARLSARRGRIIDAYLRHGGGVADFRLMADSLVFEDVLHARGRTDSIPLREASWFSVARGDSTAILLETNSVPGSAVALPDAGDELLRLDLVTPRRGVTRVYVLGSSSDRRLVGLERCSESAACITIADRQYARERLFAREHGD